MKAARFHKTGGPEVLIYEDVPDPVPGAGQKSYSRSKRRASTTSISCAAVAIRSTRRLQLDHVLPLSQAAAAHRLVEERKSTGKVVLLPWGSAGV